MTTKHKKQVCEQCREREAVTNGKAVFCEACHYEVKKQTMHDIVTVIKGGDFMVINPSKRASVYAFAPELLEACETFLKYADNGKHPGLASYANTTAGERMRQAIAKAKGE